MAWRFSPSKYKNTAPKLPKKDGIVYDLPIGNLSCTNNAIHSNSSFLAFLIDGEGMNYLFIYDKYIFKVVKSAFYLLLLEVVSYVMI